jgi:hypothetical protein
MAISALVAMNQNWTPRVSTAPAMCAGIILVWVMPSEELNRNSFQVKVKLIMAVAAAAGAANGRATRRTQPK